MIYLDYNATTPVDQRVLDAMMPYFTELFANASSNHAPGHEANKAVKNARQRVADLIHAEPYELVWTSGATEAINLALKGLFEMYRHKRNHIITVQTEHKAVLDVCKYLEEKGARVTYLPVQTDGLLDLNELGKHLTNETLVVAVMMVNNETGVIQPVADVAALTHEYGAYFMTDATQAYGKMPIDVQAMDLDLVAFSGHKISAPKGIGGLYVRNRRPIRLKLAPQIHGGGHERGLRSGTLNVPGIVGLGEASRVAGKEWKQNRDAIKLIRDNLEKQLIREKSAQINGNIEMRLHNVINFRIPGKPAKAIMASIEDVAMATGSACTSHEIKTSHVLAAMGLNEKESKESLRMSFLDYQIKNYSYRNIMGNLS